VEIENNILALVFGARLSAAQIEANLNRLTAVRTKLPEYLFTQI
jgi:hypothetical protein